MAIEMCGWQLQAHRTWQTLDGRVSFVALNGDKWLTRTYDADFRQLADAGCRLWYNHGHLLADSVRESHVIAQSILGCDSRLKLDHARSGWELVNTRSPTGTEISPSVLMSRDEQGQWAFSMYRNETTEYYHDAVADLHGTSWANRHDALMALNELVSPLAIEEGSQ